MPILVIQHPVKDFATWKKTFDSDPIGRGKSGVKRHAILQPFDDPGAVVVHLEFESKTEADAFLNALKPLWTTTADTLGVKAEAVQTRILDEVESVTYGEDAQTGQSRCHLDAPGAPGAARVVEFVVP